MYLQLDTFSNKWTVKDITDDYAALTGDVNNDGRVNVSDVTKLINMILGIIPTDMSRADVNGDGRVNVSDIAAIINIILGITAA
ncbi:MAG: dockerin type I repeat-containing protein [Muribaculaceae bacterium]|nr:dockerin type I repeat-containing protein [Muribaculaceae bacterium]